MLEKLFSVFDFSLRRYRRIRDVGPRLMSKVADGLPKGLVLSAGGDLGFLKDGRKFVFEDKSDIDFLMDRAIHDVAWEGKRWIERVCDEEIGKYTPEEQALLKAHRGPAFSLYEVTKVKPGRGVRLKELFGGRELFLTDLGFGATGQEGLIIATRVIAHLGIHYTSGATMAFRPERAKPIIESLSALYREQADAAAWRATMRNRVPVLFREYRKGGIKVEFAHIARPPAGPPRAGNDKAEEPMASREEAPRQPGRNAPCPCGSGKKYKKCCLPRKKEAVSKPALSRAERTRLIRRSDDFPVKFCYINPGWQEHGLARITVARAQENGRLIVAGFLADTFCLGIKNAFCSADVPVDRFETDMLRDYLGLKPLTIGVNYAREIVLGAEEYARGLGFEPHPDFGLARRVLGGGERPGSGNIRFGGPDGKPMYIAGPDDDAPAILKKLRDRLGEGGFGFLVPATEEGRQT